MLLYFLNKSSKQTENITENYKAGYIIGLKYKTQEFGKRKES